MAQRPKLCFDLRDKKGKVNETKLSLKQSYVCVIYQMEFYNSFTTRIHRIFGYTHFDTDLIRSMRK